MTNLHVILILDESGSMDFIKRDIVKSVNSFVVEQQELKADGTVMTFVKFNDKVKFVFEKIPINEVKEITLADYFPDQPTALYDAIGDVITKFNSDKNVCLVIVTDGQENASERFANNTIKKLIVEKQECGWNVVYLSSGLLTADQGTSIGICAAPSMCRRTSSNNVSVPRNKLGTGIATICNTAVMQIRKFGAMLGVESETPPRSLSEDPIDEVFDQVPETQPFNQIPEIQPIDLDLIPLRLELIRQQSFQPEILPIDPTQHRWCPCSKKKHCDIDE